MDHKPSEWDMFPVALVLAVVMLLLIVGMEGAGPDGANRAEPSAPPAEKVNTPSNPK